MILQVMPPTAAAKLKHVPWANTLKDALDEIPSGQKRKKAREFLADLTFLETQQLVFALKQAPDDVYDAFEGARNSGTLNQNNGDKTWKETSKGRTVSQPVAGGLDGQK